ncbi:MAG: hypothetical protein HRU15_11105, partial [Planctomycetes bacterium]|nr:hypothetical protein [Planctomycetota bacterium]
KSILNNYNKQLVDTFGCFMWSAGSSNNMVKILACRLVYGNSERIINNDSINAEDAHEIYQLELDGFDPQNNQALLKTGQRWQLRFNPHPFPDFPYNTDNFSADLILSNDEGNTLRIPAFYHESMELKNEGSYESATVDEQGYFCVRFRPQSAAHYRAELQLSWNGQPAKVIQLPDIIVHGDNYDDYVRTDKDDARFLSIDGEHFWPTGLNLKSANDDWGKTYLKTRTTPSLGTQTYEAYFARLAGAGGQVTEIWMSNWNLCLEWYDGWDSYHGLNGYSAKHAQQLEDILDCAKKYGIRVILSFRNHGQGHSRSGSRFIPSDTNEWHWNPYNKKHGGFLDSAVELFSDEQAMHRQQDLHRYICARYGDHPAIMMWKLWSEVDLTDAAKDNSFKKFISTKSLETWHQTMSTHLSELDIYDHLLTTHYSTDFHRADVILFKLKHISAVCINAYLWRLEGEYGKSYTMVQLLHDTIHKPGAFKMHTEILSSLAKPIIVTEFGGGNPYRMTAQQLRSHHYSAPWAALVSGHAIAPLFWWYEWVDQNDHWNPIQAASKYLLGEDLRGRKSRSVRLSCRHADFDIWTYAWAKPGCILGYAIEQRWAESGRAHDLIEDAYIHISKKSQAGVLVLEWWDANTGDVIARENINHPGGLLEIKVPKFRRHIAFKLKRL